MTEGTMRNGPGSGEQAERRGRQRFVRVFVLCALGAFVVGVLGRLGRQPDYSLTRETAIALALFVPILFAVGTWRLLAASDERELRHNIGAAVVGSCFYGLVYPSWLFLWMGRLVPEPNHYVLFAATGIAAFAGYLWPKLRGF